MSVVDTSALFAILLGEPDAGVYARWIERDEGSSISAATLVEAGAVALRRGGPRLLGQLDSLLKESGFEVVPLSAEHAQTATSAYLRYGRGAGSPGCLTMGDCFSYALAKSLDQPLLYKGADFAKTDVRSAL